MQKSLFEVNGIVDEEDLKPKDGINIISVRLGQN
jgi:hypothetical protein